MNRSTLGLLIAATVAVLALWFLRKEDAADPLADYPQRRFAVEQPKDIERIFIADLQGRTMTLRRNGNAWIINDSVKASAGIMQEVISALSTITIDHTPPKAGVPKILEAMQTSGLKVTAFDAGDKVLSSFILGPTAYDNRNSYAVVDGYSEPFAVRVRGLSGTLRPLFDLRSVDAWRSKDFIVHSPEKISLVELAYPKQPGESFRILKSTSGDTPRLEALSSLTKLEGQAQTPLLEDYLRVFESVPLDRRTIDEDFRDSIRREIPFAVFRVAEQASDTVQYTLWPWYIRDAFGEIDPDKPFASYFVDRNGRDFVTVQEPQIRDLLRGYSNFVQ